MLAIVWKSFWIELYEAIAGPVTKTSHDYFAVQMMLKDLKGSRFRTKQTGLMCLNKDNIYLAR